jgi:alpha-galactosidase
MKILDMRKGIRKYAGPDHWNDPDMMEVGNGMTEAEDRAHFTMWAMQAAPLIAGNDFRKMSKQTLQILTNKEAIAVDQDALGVQGFSAGIKDSVETWYKPLQDGAWAVCFLNRSKETKSIQHDWKANPIFDSVSVKELNAGKNNYVISNLWTKKGAGNTDKPFTAIVPPHDVVLLRLSK